MADHGPTPRRVRSPLRVLAICWVTIVFDGYDMITFGAVLPDLLRYRPWGLDVAEAGRLGSLALVGMLVGTLVIGTLTDTFGRRRIMLGCLVWFSVATLLTGLAPNPELFGLLRFVTGLGLGGVVPTAIALTVEYSPPARRQLHNALMFSGYSCGGVLAALLALVLLPVGGFRLMFFAGATPLVLVVPLTYFLLPESVAFLTARGRLAEARRYATRYGIEPPTGVEAPARAAAARGGALDSVRLLFSRRYLPSTLLFWVISLIGLLLVYGLNTWLPELMRGLGYSMSSSLTFLLLFNAGAVAGVIGAAALADRFGERVVICGSFAVAALAVLMFAARPGAGPLLVLMAAAGFGANTQTLVNAFVAGHYPPSARATSVGWALGIGRIGGILGPVYGGFFLAAVRAGSLSPGWTFYAFAIPAVLAAGLVALVPRSPRSEAAEPAAARPEGVTEPTPG